MRSFENRSHVAPGRSETEAERDGGDGRRLHRYAPLALIIVGVVLAYLMGWHRYLSLEVLAEQRDLLHAEAVALGLAGPLLFGAIYALAVALAFPAAGALTVFGGFLFGWLTAGITVVVAATIGATAIFLAARSALGAPLRARLGGRIEAFSRGFEDDAFGYLLVLRMTPVLPFFVVNVAPAFFNIPTRTYVATTFLGILPGTFALAYLGEGVDSVLTAAREAGTQPVLADLVTREISLALGGLAVLAIAAMTVRTLWKRRRRRKERGSA